LEEKTMRVAELETEKQQIAIQAKKELEAKNLQLEALSSRLEQWEQLALRGGNGGGESVTGGCAQAAAEQLSAGPAAAASEAE